MLLLSYVVVLYCYVMCVYVFFSVVGVVSPRFWYYLVAIGGGLVLLFVIFLLYRRYRMRQLEASMHSQGLYHGREALLEHQQQQTGKQKKKKKNQQQSTENKQIIQ